MLVRYLNAYFLFPLLEKKTNRIILPKLKELNEFFRLSMEEQEDLRKKEFYKLLSFCRNQVPYYQDIFKKYSFDELKVLRDLRYIEDLPLLTKEIVREHSDRIRIPTAHHIRKTGGSTGQSVFFYYDNEGLDWTSAVNLKAYEMVGNFPHKKDCHICSELGLKPLSWYDHLIGWIKLLSQNRKRLMINSFSEEDLHDTYKNLVKINPYLLQGHPSSAFAIANYIKNKNFPIRKYCVIFEPSGEMLTSKQVAMIEKYLGCKVVNRYGNAEFGVMAHSQISDSYNRLKVFNRLFYIEEISQGSLVVSNCTNYSFPLLRYDTGDIGTVKNEKDGTYIYDIMGRVHDLVKIEGIEYATHYLMDFIDHKVGGIRQFQILVKGSEIPILRIVPEDTQDQQRIKSELLKRWPKGIEIEFVDFESLKRVGWQQKFRHIIDLDHSFSEKD
jgi:phenylacetate-CoA ligase